MVIKTVGKVYIHNSHSGNHNIFMLSYDNNNSPIESNRDCLQAKEAFYEGNKQP